MQQQIHPLGHLVQQVHRAGGGAVEHQRQIGGGEAGIKQLVAEMFFREPDQAVALFGVEDLHISQNQDGHDLGFAPL